MGLPRADRQRRPYAWTLWTMIESVCQQQFGGARPVRRLATLTQVPEGTLRAWFERRIVPPWADFQPLLQVLGIGDTHAHAELSTWWAGAWDERQRLDGGATREAASGGADETESRNGHRPRHRRPVARSRRVALLVSVSGCVALVAFIALGGPHHSSAQSIGNSLFGGADPQTPSPVGRLSGSAVPSATVPAPIPAASGSTRSVAPSGSVGPVSTAASCQLAEDREPHVVIRQCRFSLSSGHSVDLDSEHTNMDVTTAVNEDIDIHFAADGLSVSPGTPGELAYPQGTGNEDACLAATNTATRVPMSSLTLGRQVCLTTTELRTALLVVRSVPTGGTQAVIELEITVWGRDAH